MKVQASVKKVCRNCKIVRRNRVVRVICSRTRATSSVRVDGIKSRLDVIINFLTLFLNVGFLMTFFK